MRKKPGGARPRARARSGRAERPATSRDDLGLSPSLRAFLFDLDGVLTPTARLHARAWKQMFDAFLRERSRRTGGPFRPFDPVADYDRYVDGKPRGDGVRSFLRSRGIRLPEGDPDDPPELDTIAGLGNRKNRRVLALIHRVGVRPYPGSLRYLRAVRAAGRRCAVVSSSTNCRDVLRVAGLLGSFHTIVDGHVSRRLRLRGKPAPDTYLAAARRLKVPPKRAAVFEDALAGVEAGRRGRFGATVGVDRVGQARELRRHGADIVVRDLAELLETR